MKRYQVVDPKGVLHNGEKLAKGQILPASVTGAQEKAWLRFGQIKEVVEKPAKASEQKPDGKPADGKASEESDKTSEQKPADPK